MPHPSAYELELATEELKSHKSAGTDQKPADVFKAGCRKIRPDIVKLLILFEIRRNCLTSKSRRSLYLFIRTVTRHCSNYTGMPHMSITKKFYSTYIFQRQRHTQKKLLGIVSVNFEATGQLLNLYSAFVKYLGKNGNKMNRYIFYL